MSGGQGLKRAHLDPRPPATPQQRFKRTVDQPSYLAAPRRLPASRAAARRASAAHGPQRASRSKVCNNNKNNNNHNKNNHNKNNNKNNKKVCSKRSVPALVKQGRSKARPGTEQKQRSGSKAPAIRQALQLYQELWAEYSTSLETEDHEFACQRAETLATKRYKELHAAGLELLQRVVQGQAAERRVALGVAYHVLTFKGKAAEEKRNQSNLSARLEKHREDSQGRARDALCAALACLCCRLQKSWLAEYDDEVPVRGYFVHALVDAACTFRISLRPGRQPRMASVVITSERSLVEALAHTDHGGPLPDGHHKEALGDRQYGLQRIAVTQGKGEERREMLQEVQPLEAMRELMGSKRHVLVLDMYCALAPKELVHQYSLGEIIREELMSLLRDAKQRGVAVLFLLGGEQPVELATKVYLQPWVTAIGGLQCGYVRWREGPDKPWEPPKQHHSKRLIFGLQLP
ncbi:unnamed protein product [Polarella glacialis]|uniref:Uncharacterized protein n=1 Tax=Polarella glacialis TaxID=89957 RepID=A0A813FPK5_POLGL|nr:unnamed protein product [Polarella glacialis]